MKKIVFILLFVPLIFYSQTDSEFIFQKSFSPGLSETCINEEYCFSLSWDLPYNYNILYYSYEGGTKQLIDTVFAHVSTLNCFKNEEDNSYVVLWNIYEGGDPSYIYYVYYVRDGKLMKIGEWGITEDLDIHRFGLSLAYSVRDIRIHRKNDIIEFLFLKGTSFFVYEENFKYDDWSKYFKGDYWGTFKAGELKVSFNIVDRSLKVIERD